MGLRSKYSPKSRELAAELKDITTRRSQINRLGYTHEEILEMGMVLAQLGVFPREAVKIARLGKIANVRGLEERDLMRINVKE